MSLFDIFKRKTNDDIWQIEDPAYFVCEMNERICEKCKYGDEIQKLSSPEKTFYIVQQLEMEVNNGGFSQFFFNSAGNFSNDLVQCFTEIGALKIAAICRMALDAFGTKLPENWEARQNLLDELESDEINDILSECDDAFYAYPDDLNALSYAYVMHHKDAFN